MKLGERYRDLYYDLYDPAAGKYYVWQYCNGAYPLQKRSFYFDEYEKDRNGNFVLVQKEVAFKQATILTMNGGAEFFKD